MEVDLELGLPLFGMLPQGVGSKELLFPFPGPLPVPLPRVVFTLLTFWVWSWLRFTLYVGASLSACWLSLTVATVLAGCVGAKLPDSGVLAVWTSALRRTSVDAKVALVLGGGSDCELVPGVDCELVPGVDWTVMFGLSQGGFRRCALWSCMKSPM